MQFRKTGIVLLTVLLLTVAVLCGKLGAQAGPQDQAIQDPVPVLFQTETEEITQTIKPWLADDGICYVFLPSWAEPEHLTVSIKGKTQVWLGNQKLENGAVCGFVQPGQVYPVSCITGGETVQTGMVFLQSGSLPSVNVDTRSGDMHYIHSLKGSEEPGSLQIVLPDGQLHFRGSLTAVGGRGNATWDREKKSYKLELQQEADILGMGAAKKWVLLSNTFDPSHIRNKAVLDTAGKLGLPFSPESTWVDLYLNGEYAGLYLLCEKNEIHPRRVDIGEETGVLISIEKEDRLWEYGSSQFITDHGIPIRIRQTGMEVPLLQEKLRCAENAILAPDGIDPVSGKHYTELIDTQSWAKKYLIEEIFGNLDAGSISQFFYWEGDGKIFAGPVWDYDITMGNPNNWQLEDPMALFAGRPNLWNPEDTPWLYALYQKPEFRETVTALYESQFRSALQGLTESGLNAYETEIRTAAALDQIRWSTESCPDTVEAMKEYMLQRLDFLDRLWLEKETYRLVSVYIREHVMACHAVPDGDTFPEMPVPGGTDTIFYEAWCDGDTDQPFDFTAPITADKLIYLKETNLLEPGGEDSGFSLRKAITYVPLAVMLILMAAMLAKDKFHAGKEGRSRYDQSKVSP